jgi:putative alpha-1,2-mannosidase
MERNMNVSCKTKQHFVVAVAIVMLIILSAGAGRSFALENLAPFVDVFVGGGVNVLYGPSLPHASINPGPQTSIMPKTETGFVDNDPIQGFGQFHAQGTGWYTYGNLVVTPHKNMLEGYCTKICSVLSLFSDLILAMYIPPRT